jgi:predicted NAD/FAD-binding protein
MPRAVAVLSAWLALVTLVAHVSALPARVAIVGSGIGGAAAAHWLSQFEGVQIDLFEQEDKVGG